MSESPYRDGGARLTLEAKLRLADVRRMIDMNAPFVGFIGIGVFLMFVDGTRLVALGILAPTAIAWALLWIWLLRCCIVEIPWPYRAVSWSMPASFFRHAPPQQIDVHVIERVTTAVVFHDDMIAHQVAFETRDGGRVLLSTDINYGSLGKAHAEQQAKRLEALIERARGDSALSE